MFAVLIHNLVKTMEHFEGVLTLNNLIANLSTIVVICVYKKLLLTCFAFGFSSRLIACVTCNYKSHILRGLTLLISFVDSLVVFALILEIKIAL